MLEVVFEEIRRRAIESVPFARHMGLEVVSVGNGSASAQLLARPEVLNHVGTLHAAALFGVGEAASGAAMASALAPVIQNVRPVVSKATIRYSKPAKGLIIARAKVEREPASLVAELREKGVVQFVVAVELVDQEGSVRGDIQVEWHASIKL